MKSEDIKSYKVLENHDELIVDKNFRYHLYRNCEELTKNVQALKATSYSNDWWKYRDTTGFEHLFNAEGIELTKDIKTMVVECYKNNIWKYMAKNGSWNIIDSNGNNITPEGFIEDCYIYSNQIEYKIKDDAQTYVQTLN